MIELVLTILFIIVTVTFGYYLRFLTLSGSIAAFVVGTFTLLGFQIKGLLLLGLFFASSSLWSKYKRKMKTKVEERHEKGARRDWAQVMANGGGAAIASFIYFLSPNPLWLFLFAVMLASSNSDTWASEIGTLSRKKPLSIRTMSVAKAGTSGAISALGTFAALMGSLFIAAAAMYIFQLSWQMTVWVFAFGFIGNVIDTILGAFLQAVYCCPTCRVETEKIYHCGENTKLIRGFAFLNNDVVNFLSGIIAAVLSVFVYLFI